MEFEAGINFYAYVQNNPINYNDPMGLDPLNPFTGQPNSTLQCHVNPHWDYNENLIGALLLTAPLTDSAGAIAGGTAGTIAGGLTFVSELAKGNSISGATRESIINGVTTGVSVGTSVTTGNFWLSSSASAATNAALQEYFYHDVNPNRVIASSIPTSVGSAALATSSLTPFQSSIVVPLVGTPSSTASQIILDHYYPPTNDLSASGSASGGFVLYPNKPNTNMMHQVYAK